MHKNLLEAMKGETLHLEDKVGEPQVRDLALLNPVLELKVWEPYPPWTSSFSKLKALPSDGSSSQELTLGLGNSYLMATRVKRE